MYRGLIHFHSEYSYDSITSIKSIVKFSLKSNLNFLVLTDHDTIKGSIELKKYIEKNNIPIEVIIAAEYNTEYGDIIALGINKEILNMKFDLFVDEVRENNGLLLFPHPYKGHINIEYIAQKVDMIEAFNSRTDDKSNDKALKLSYKYNKPVYYASDAHNYNNFKNCIIEFNKNDSFLNSVMNNNIFPHNKHKTKYFEVLYSQYIKSLKTRNLKLFIQMSKSLLLSCAKFRIVKSI